MCGATHEHLPLPLKNQTRYVDNVFLNYGQKFKKYDGPKGEAMCDYNQASYNIWTMDCFPDKLKATESIKIEERDTKQRKKLVVRDLIQDKILVGATNALFVESADIQTIMRKDKGYIRAWNCALDYYFLGKFEASKPFIEECLKIDPGDGPCLEMLSFMNSCDFKSPQGWRGARNIVKELKRVVDI